MAKWTDIEQFYRVDCKRAYRLAPKLTESHINPNNVKKMKVKYATQVLSNTVAAAMYCSVESGVLERDSLGTITFIKLMDRSFDVLNSSVKKSPNKYKIAFSSKPYQNEMLDQMYTFLSNGTVTNKAEKNSNKFNQIS